MEIECLCKFFRKSYRDYDNVKAREVVHALLTRT